MGKKNNFSYQEIYDCEKLDFIEMQKENIEQFINLIITVSIQENDEDKLCFTDYIYNEYDNTITEIFTSVKKSLLKELSDLTMR